MRFDLDDEQRAIRDAVRDLCTSRYDPAGFLGGEPPPDRFWPELAASGWTQLAIPKRLGGAAGGLVELCLVVEELGYALAPGAFAGNACAAIVLAAAGRDAAELEPLASGAQRAAFAQMIASDRAVGWDIDGAALVVLAGTDRAALLQPAPQELETVASPDVTRRFTAFASTGAAEIAGSVAEALDCCEVILAAELVGVAQHGLDLAVEHAKQRQQFGRPIGAYQAVSHRCADMLVEVESARSAVLSAAWTADNDPGALRFAASVAKVAASEAAWQVTSSSLQVHGGIGFTWEHPIHLFMRRALATIHTLGSVDEHLDRVAALSGLPSASGGGS